MQLSATNVKQYVDLVNNAVNTLQQQLAMAQQAVANVSQSVQNDQNLLTSTNNAYNQLLSNKATDDSNVFTLQTQLALAQQNLQKAQAVSTSLQNQIVSATDAYKIAVTSFSVASAGKQASDGQLQQLLAMGLSYPNQTVGNLQNNK